MKEELLEPIFRKIRVNKIKKHIPEKCVICDLGCGTTGEFLEEMNNRFLYGYGFDIDAKNKISENYIIKAADISKSIPLDDKSVDCVTLLAVLEHLSDPHDILSECYRILKPEGRILLTTPAPISKLILEFLSYKLSIVSPRQIADHKHYYSHNELRDLLIDAGFKSVKVFSFELGLNNCAIGFREGCTL